jgi:hypothetical protein
MTIVGRTLVVNSPTIAPYAKASRGTGAQGSQS